MPPRTPTDPPRRFHGTPIPPPPPPLPPLPPVPLGADFDGDTYESDHDHARLTGQLKRVFDCMKDGEWRTYDEINLKTGDPQASIGARLRDLRKRKFGSYTMESRPRGERHHGLWEYHVGPPKPPDPTTPQLPLETEEAT